MLDPRTRSTGPDASPGRRYPIAAAPLRLGELVATFALAQDNAFGQPLESQLRSCLLASWLAEEAGLGRDVRETTYWVALLRYLGCTGHAHEVAMLFGDEIAIRAQTLVHDAGNPAEVMRDVLAFATAGLAPAEQDEMVRTIQAGAHDWAVHNFASGCEVGDMLARRLDVGPQVREALGFTFERWNGTGFPDGASGEAIPPAMRIVHLSQDMEAISRVFSVADALDAARDRRDRTYDPALADLLLTHGQAWFDRLDKLDPWDAVLDLEPEPHRTFAGRGARRGPHRGRRLRRPEVALHGRSQPTLRPARRGGGPPVGARRRRVATVRRAALVHEFGTTAVPNSIWDKPGPLTRSEFDRVELHPMLTEQMLRRSAALAGLNPVAAAHHERATHPATTGTWVPTVSTVAAGLLAAADIYVAMTSDRADRPAGPPTRPRSSCVDWGPSASSRAAIDCVLDAAGHGGPTARDVTVTAGPRTRVGCRPRGAGAPPRGAEGSPPAPSASSSPSRRRPPTTTSSTSTPRSVCRPARPPHCGRCRTGSSARPRTCRRPRRPAAGPCVPPAA